MLLKRNDMEDDITVEHESFGLLSFARTTSNIGKHLFGSSIKHSNTIHLKINACQENRGLNRYWYFPRETIINVEMSYSQFAEAIVAMNTTGVPCTIRSVLTEHMEDCPGESQRELFEKEFQGTVLALTDKLKNLKLKADELLDKKGPMKVAEKKEISHMLHMMVMEVRSNLPFIQSSYNKAMDKTTMEAKSEIESFVNHQVHALGLEEFKKQFKQLSANQPIEIEKD
jgi:hypothetical protein